MLQQETEASETTLTTEDLERIFAWNPLDLPAKARRRLVAVLWSDPRLETAITGLEQTPLASKAPARLSVRQLSRTFGILAEEQKRGESIFKAASSGPRELDPAIAQRLEAHLLSDPRLREPLAELDRMLRDAKLSRDTGEEAVLLHKELNQLITRTTWEHPVEVLEYDIEEENCQRLVNVARARRAREKSKRVAEAAAKLEECLWWLTGGQRGRRRS